MNERTPLLRVIPTRREKQIRRYAGVTLAGFILYCIYLTLFLPRTSYQRDWNHLHDNTISRQEIERFVVKNTDQNQIYSYAQKYYLSGEHLPGSAPQLAEWTRTKFQEFGLGTHISTHDAQVAIPRTIGVRVLGDSPFDLDLNEPGLEPDPLLEGSIPPFHAYAANGTVQGPLVYGSYARVEDLIALRDRGVELVGTILLARSSNHIPLHTQAKNAKMYGCLALLTYHDYADDGLFTPENGHNAYPSGPARSPHSVERDTVLDYTQKPGQIPRHGIPSIPISLANARKLFTRIPDGGPDSQTIVEVHNHQDMQLRPLSNVFGSIKGISGQQVIIGNHRDAFTLGAADGNSGSAVLLELARVLGELHKRGWKPFRTITFASWDGGRYGMLGSTAWARENRHKLRKHAATYIDIGAAYTGPEFVAKSSPLLRALLRECAQRAPSPDLTNSLADYWVAGSHGHDHIGSLDTGDFNVFYNHLGIPSLTARFQSNKTSHIYHRGSNYDTLHWQKVFGDTDFSSHAALTRFLGLVVGRLASTPVLPLRVTDYGRTIQRNVLAMLGERQEQGIRQLHDACSQFSIAAAEYDAEIERLESEYILDYPWYKFWKKLQLGIMMHVSNFKLTKIEQSFLYRQGLTGRPWYRHAIFGPDRKNSGTRALPGLHEALEDNDKDEVFYWVDVLERIMRETTSLLQ